MDYQDRYIHMKEISVDFINRRPPSALELVFKDAAGIKHKSNTFKQGDLVHWNFNMYVRTHTSATLTIRLPLFNLTIAEIAVEFKPNEFIDDRAVGLEDTIHTVTVNFVCGTSQSLADVTRVLGSLTRNAYVSKVPRFLKLPQFAVPPPHATIHRLNDDTLLDIFNYYRLDKINGWNVRLGWCKLSHVCRRWRHLMHDSTFHLGLHIRCTEGAPIVDTLDYLPPLPLLVNFTSTVTEQDEQGIYQALRLHDRVRHIHLRLPPSILHKCLVLMDQHFPILEYLSLSFTADKITTLTLPTGFLAPNLHHLTLPGICPPKRLRVLASTVSLITLSLSNIQQSTYIRPRVLVARLLSLPQLKKLSIGFAVAIPRPSAERELLGGQGTPVTLPNLKTLTFRGVSAYLESLVVQIRAPLLERLDITLFNQVSFVLPHLSHLINATEGFKLPNARVLFDRDGVSLLTSRYSSRWTDGPCHLRVMCKYSDWQINCTAQICTALMPALSGVPERFTLYLDSEVLLSEWRNADIDPTTLIEFSGRSSA